jgi:hypothetical protein
LKKVLGDETGRSLAIGGHSVQPRTRRRKTNPGDGRSVPGCSQVILETTVPIGAVALIRLARP